MYKICSQFLIVLSCVMLMVVSLQVDYVMIACILTGIIVCTFIDMQGVPQMSPAKESKTADRAFDLILAVYILSGVFFAPSFFMLPYAAMDIQKEKIHGIEDGCSLSGDSCIGGLYFKDKTYSTRDFLYPGGCTSHGFCGNAFVFHRAAFGGSDEDAQHERCVHGARHAYGADESPAYREAECADIQCHAKGEKPYRKGDTRQRGSHDYALYFAGGSNRCDKY